MDQDELDANIEGARALMDDEAVRSGPTGHSEGPAPTSALTDSDLAALRAKFPFLKEFSDGFIRANKPDCLMRMETANMKLREAERTKDADDKLAHNRMNIGVISVDMGVDDRKGYLMFIVSAKICVLFFLFPFSLCKKNNKKIGPSSNSF
jgi:hypothetical protein